MFFQPISLRSVFISYSHLLLGLPGYLFPSGFPNRIPYAFVFSPVPATLPPLSPPTLPPPLILSPYLYLVSSTNHEAFHYHPVTSSLLGPNISLSTLFSNTLSRFDTIYSVHFDGMAAPLTHTIKVLYRYYMFRHHTILRQLHTMTTAYKYNTVYSALTAQHTGAGPLRDRR
jgi:hypothetical protein